MTRSYGRALLDEAPTTPKRVEYGTPEMAYAVRRLFEAPEVRRRKIFVMAAHDGGLVTFGRDLQEAFGILKNEMGSHLNSESFREEAI